MTIGLERRGGEGGGRRRKATGPGDLQTLPPGPLWKKIPCAVQSAEPAPLVNQAFMSSAAPVLEIHGPAPWALGYE